MGSFVDSLKHAWNAFKDNDEYRKEPSSDFLYFGGYSRPDRPSTRLSNDQTVVVPILTRLAMDVASIDIKHVKVDEQGRFESEVDSGLNYCLNVEANMDQAATAFRQDVAMTLFDKGVAAIVPVDTSLNPNMTGGYDIKTLRVGEIVQWYPKHVKVRVYNEEKGRREDIVLAKSYVAIVENPLYAIMNEANSTLKRLVHKLALLDKVDDQVSSGKMNMIIQLPYIVKSEGRQKQAENRRKALEEQLQNSKYGIGYIDGTEKITQLNRPLDNNLLSQIEYLQKMLYSQLGLTEEIMNGTASEQTMQNYQKRTIQPILVAITEAIARTFLTKTARSQKQTIKFFRDPFELVPVGTVAELADKFTRNEIMSSNEIRTSLGMLPSKDPKADELRNSNMPQNDSQSGYSEEPEEEYWE